MDAWKISEQITQVIRWDSEKFFAICSTDQDRDVFLHGKVLRKAGLLTTHADGYVEPLNLIGKHVTTIEEAEDKLDRVQKISDRPTFSFEFDDDEVPPFLDKIRTGAPLTDDEQYFLEAVFRAPQEGHVDNHDAWQNLRFKILAAQNPPTPKPKRVPEPAPVPQVKAVCGLSFRTGTSPA